MMPGLSSSRRFSRATSPQARLACVCSAALAASALFVPPGQGPAAQAQEAPGAEVRQRRVLEAVNGYWAAWSGFTQLYDVAERNFAQVRATEGAEVFRSIESAALSASGTALGAVAVEVAKLGAAKASERAFLNIVGLALTGADIAEWLPTTGRLTVGFWNNQLQIMALRSHGQRVATALERLEDVRAQAHHGDADISIYVQGDGVFGGTCRPSWSGPAVVRVSVAAGGGTRTVQARCEGEQWQLSGPALTRGAWAAFAVLTDGRNAVAVSQVLSGEQL